MSIIILIYKHFFEDKQPVLIMVGTPGIGRTYGKKDFHRFRG